MQTDQPKTEGAAAVVLQRGVMPQWVDNFKALLQKRNAKIRGGSKMTIVPETGETNTLHTIEVKHPGMGKYLPLKMPDGGWYFERADDRDMVLTALRHNGSS